jgi:hypothetical protein
VGAGGPGGGPRGGQGVIITGLRLGESSEQAIVLCASSRVRVVSVKSIFNNPEAILNNIFALSCVTPPLFNKVPFIVAVKRLIRDPSEGVIGTCILFFLTHGTVSDDTSPLL